MVPATTIVRTVTLLAALLLLWSLAENENYLDPGQIPTADPGGPYAGPEGVPVLLDGSASRAHRHDGVIARWMWDFGDGTPETIVEQPTVLHRFPPGEHRVQLTVLDGQGRRSQPRETVCRVRHDRPAEI